MRLVPLPVYARLFRALDAVLPSELTDRPAGDSVRKLADVIGAASLDDVYRCLISHWQDPAAVVLGIEPGRARSPLTALPADADLDQAVRHMMRMDLSGYHPDDILVKVDRATMRVGLEARLPLIDHRVVEFAQTLPLAYLLRGGRSKWILREILNRYVPPALIERPKKGFAMPVGAWLRGGLRDWAEELLSAPRLRDGGFLDPGPVRRLWAQHCAGTHDWQDRLWDVLMFQAWLDHSAS